MPSALHLLTRNWKLKLAAVGLAVSLWIVVRVPAGPSRGILRDVPVRVQLNDPEWVLASEPAPPSVQVRIQGPNGELVSLQLARPVLRMPIDRVTARDTVVQLRRDWLPLRDHPGVVVDDIQPSSVRLRFEAVESAAVPLALRLDGSLPDTLALTQPLTLSPQVARISGPASRLRVVDSIPLQPLDLSEVEESRDYQVPLDTTGLGDLGVSPSATTVAVRVETLLERVVTGVEVEVDDPAEIDEGAYEFVPATFQLTLSGPRTRVETLDADSLRIVIDDEALEGLEPGEERSVSVRLRGVPSMVDVSAPSESVTVRRREEP